MGGAAAAVDEGPVRKSGGAVGRGARGRKRGGARGGTRERLLDVAERLFAERGFHGTSLRDIGAELAMANSSLLHHFPTKARLYAAVLERIADSLGALHDDVAAAPGEGMAPIMALVDGLFDWTLARPHYARIVMRELIDNAARAERVERWYFAEIIAELSTVIAEGQERGSLRACDPMLFLFHVIGSVSYFLGGLPTIAGIAGVKPKKLIASYRDEIKGHLARSLAP